MAAARRTQPASLISTGLSAATVALNVAGAATDAVPIVKQILNSAAHISAVAERIQKKREAMYTLVEKASIYATQINVTVAGRVLDATLQRRLERLFTVFEKIEALVEDKVVRKNGARARLAGLWQKLIAKPNLAETLAAELDREIQLFQLVTGVQQTLTLEDVARVVAADVRYDGRFRLLRDCDVETLKVIRKCDTEVGTVVWASARVDGQPMVVRYVDGTAPARDEAVLEKSRKRPVPVDKLIDYWKKVSRCQGSSVNLTLLLQDFTVIIINVLTEGSLPSEQ
ncbi:hypothetical protein EXIGLDRAFT_756276, partial [Exidia glandulosa HHB12029]